MFTGDETSSEVLRSDLDQTRHVQGLQTSVMDFPPGVVVVSTIMSLCPTFQALNTEVTPLKTVEFVMKPLKLRLDSLHFDHISTVAVCKGKNPGKLHHLRLHLGVAVCGMKHISQTHQDARAQWDGEVMKHGHRGCFKIKTDSCTTPMRHRLRSDCPLVKGAEVDSERQINLMRNSFCGM